MDWFPWYPDLYAADTMHLSLAEDGAYRRLIDHYMKTRQPLPDNDRALARILGIGIEEWDPIKGTIRAFFWPDGGALAHKRCDKVLSEQDARATRMSEQRKKAAASRWQHARKEPESEPDAARIRAECGGDATGQDKTRQDKKEVRQADAREARPPAAISVNGGSHDRKKGKRLPDDWQPGLEDRAYATGLGLDPGAVAEQFRDYWHARAGAGATKLDWQATWRTWCRKDAERRANGTGGARSQAGGILEAGARALARLQRDRPA
jgi:uncharacterized protein YdaU (DUF1376 family)